MLFCALVKKAESLFKSEKLEESKTEYANALKLFPEEEKPKSQIIEIDKLLAAKKLEEEEKAKKEKEYQALIASADKLVNEKKYLQSIAEYTDALKIKKAEKYPANQIKKVEGLIKAEEELAKKAEKEKAEKEKLEAKYNSLIADANKLFEKESYQESIEIYLKALEIKKAEKIPTEQIAKAKEFIKIAKDKAKAEAEKIAAANKLETEYKELREKGDKSYKSNNYSASTSFYEQALVKKPGDSYSISQIEKIKDILTAEKEKADKLAADLLAEKKRKEQEAADKKAAADKLEKAYQALIAKADKSRDSKKYTESIGIYEEALVIKPKDSYSLTQIDKIKEIIKAEKAKAAELLSESERLKQEAADKKAAADKLEKEYLALIVKADENYKGNNYAKSTGFYQDALVKKPGDSYSISQIEKIKDILTAEKEKADRIAADLLAEEKRKLAAAANKKDAAKKLEAEYNALILEANDPAIKWLYGNITKGGFSYNKVGPLFTNNLFGYRCEFTINSIEKYNVDKTKWTDLV